MKKKLTSVLSLLMIIALLSCCLWIPAMAATNSIIYSWAGMNAYDAGFAQGTITVNADAGTYYLYWADNSAALGGFDPICKLSVTSSGSASYTMPEYTAIPAKATYILGFKSSSVPTNLSASAAALSYKLPIDKVLNKSDSDLLYKFASYSDMHVCSNEEGSNQNYPYDEEHLADAFRVAADRDVDFIVTTGDHVNSQRADAKGGANPFYPEEWNTYLKILAESDYDNPIYEAIGNHELWNYDTESDYSGKDWKTGSDYFRTVTGLDSTTATMNSGKAYYEVTEPTTGDHFLFMALEGGFYTDRVDEFTDEQLNWLDAKLTAYENDGKNTFILEHANFNRWGAGDLLDKPVYDIPLKDSCTSTAKLKALLQKHQSAVLICGHTHFKLDLQLNYSTNTRTSATIIHNSSVGGVRDIQNGTRVNDKSRELCEGYIVEVYKDATIFYGTNLYYNKVNPSVTYIVPQKTSAINPPTEAPTEAKKNIWGDADDDGDVSTLDVTYIQRKEVGLTLPTPIKLENCDVDGDNLVTVLDATMIQRYIAGIINRFPVEEIAAFRADSALAAVGSQGELVPSAADLNTLRTQAKTALDKYRLLASYDQYQALKKAYRRNMDYDTLNTAYTDFNTAVQNFYTGDMIDVYFSNNVGWSNVYAYCSAGHGKAKNASWPGQKMTQVGTNSYGEKIYKITLPSATYNFIIFTNNSGQQTVDLPLGITKNQGYYYDSKLGKDNRGYLKCSYYIYE